MADDDFYNATYTTAMNDYGRELAQAQAQLVQAEANYDTDSAADATRAMAEIRLRIAEYDRMARQHAAAMRPPTRDPRTDIDLTPAEAMKVCGLDPNNSNDVATYNAGWHRLQALKARGMYRE